GIVAGVIPPLASDWTWRPAFLAGAIAAPVLIVPLTGYIPPFDSPTSAPWLVAGGLIVGAGVHFGSGCTSAHGGRGLARLSPPAAPWLVAGGLLVGAGVHFGSGCTSGHVVCGMARLSPRSILATLTFMGTTAITVFVVRHVIGGF